eukprot:764311-Hanusia_phi.AAC.5
MTMTMMRRRRVQMRMRRRIAMMTMVVVGPLSGIFCLEGLVQAGRQAMLLMFSGVSETFRVISACHLGDRQDWVVGRDAFPQVGLLVQRRSETGQGARAGLTIDVFTVEETGGKEERVCKVLWNETGPDDKAG